VVTVVVLGSRIKRVVVAVVIASHTK